MFPTSLQFSVPLAYDTVYYVESPDNEPLNQAMRQLAAAGQPLFANPEMQPFPFKLLCLSQEELAADRLSSGLADRFDPELVADTIADLRECLHADTGGTLTARCLPKFDYNGNMDDDDTVCISTEFGGTRPENALSAAASFAREVAEKNFFRVSGTSYSSFQDAKEEARRPRYSQNTWGEGRSSGRMMSFMMVRQDPKEIVRKLQERLAEISDTIDENTKANEIIVLLEADLEKWKQKGKQKTFYPLIVKEKDIFLQIPDGKPQKLKFIRGEVAKTLYIFFLQQIARAADKHTAPIYLSKQDLADHKKELYDIYWRLGGTKVKKIEDINLWWDGPYGDFSNALSSIRSFFKKEFDVAYLQNEFKKCYTIEVMGKDANRKDIYGIALDAKDIIWESHKYQK